LLKVIGEGDYNNTDGYLSYGPNEPAIATNETISCLSADFDCNETIWFANLSVTYFET
jgi:hypothetical protein